MSDYTALSEDIKEVLLFIDNSFNDGSMRNIADFETLVDALKKTKPEYLGIVFQYAYAFNLLFKERDYDKLGDIITIALENYGR